MTARELSKHIKKCKSSAACAAIRKLDAGGARLVKSPKKAGRLCEIAVVAAAGTDGLHKSDVVAARREFAKHLGITLAGRISDADWPIHIHHALTNSNHHPGARHRINLGVARATFKNERYYLI